ncbi:MAG: cytochrome c [Betaproteobacteria bacterium]|nr:cytochrome c [Betaproteobacteria bacterium]
MLFSARITGFAIAVVVSAFALLHVAPSHAASGEEIIKARVSFMEDDIGGHWKVLAAFAKNGTGTLADVEKSATALSKLTEKIPSHFPKDTGRGHFPDKMTRALPVIWTNADQFKKDIKILADGTEKLARLAKEGDKDAVVAMIGTAGSYARTNIGCAECHKTFRGERVK